MGDGELQKALELLKKLGDGENSEVPNLHYKNKKQG